MWIFHEKYYEWLAAFAKWFARQIAKAIRDDGIAPKVENDPGEPPPPPPKVP